MKLEDFGIDPKTKMHNARLTVPEGRFLGLLWIDHVGRENRIGADVLAVKYEAALAGGAMTEEQAANYTEWKRKHDPERLMVLKRDVRYMQNHLLFRHDNIAILSQSGHRGGYWVAEDEEEAAAFYGTFRKRGLTGLLKATRGKKAAMVELMTQVSFEFEDLVDRSDAVDREQPGGRDDSPAAVAVVDAFLSRMLKDPERYAADLKRIGEKFSSVLLPRSRAAAIKAKAGELSRLLEGI